MGRLIRGLVGHAFGDPVQPVQRDNNTDSYNNNNNNNNNNGYNNGPAGYYGEPSYGGSGSGYDNNYRPGRRERRAERRSQRGPGMLSTMGQLLIHGPQPVNNNNSAPPQQRPYPPPSSPGPSSSLGGRPPQAMMPGRQPLDSNNYNNYNNDYQPQAHYDTRPSIAYPSGLRSEHFQPGAYPVGPQPPAQRSPMAMVAATTGRRAPPLVELDGGYVNGNTRPGSVKPDNQPPPYEAMGGRAW